MSAEAELRHDRVLDANVPELALDVVGRILRPDLQHDLDRLEEHAATLGAIADLEQLVIGRQPARPDAEHETAAAHVIELRDFAGDDGRVVVRQVDDGGAERQILRLRDQAGEEHQRRGERFGDG